MPLRILRVPRPAHEDVLHLAISAATLTKELSSLSFFPPATAAVSVLLIIFETIQSIQTNREACNRLARRCARLLLDINDQMQGRWDFASPLLIRNLDRLQVTLQSILQFMKKEAGEKWSRRFMRKTSIEGAIIEFNMQLDNAVQSFQVASLIDIHYTLSSRSAEKWEMDKKLGTEDPNRSRTSSLPPPYESSINIEKTPVEKSIMISEEPLDTAREDDQLLESTALENVPLDCIVSDGALEDRSFHRYHQSEVQLQGRARAGTGWWSDASVAEVNGQPILVKHYGGSQSRAMKHWLRDVKILQNIYHPSLPQMIGYSEVGTPIPFILLSNVKTRSPQALLLNTLDREGLAVTTSFILRFYQDITDATFHFQRQLGLTSSKTQDFISGASYRVDGSGTVIVGLPPPKEDIWYTMRSYGLTESLTMAVLDMLPKSGTVQYTRDDDAEESNQARKLNHLVTLVRGLLPGAQDQPVLSLRVKSLLEGSENDDGDAGDELNNQPKLNLKQLRISNIEAGAHGHEWKENGGIPPHKFAVGDFGYIPAGRNFSDFVALGNVIEDGLEKLTIEHHTSGVQWCWNDMPIRHTSMEAYDLPDHVRSWPVAVPPNAQIDCQVVHAVSVSRAADAWRFLLDKGGALAKRFSVKPEDIILITRAGKHQNFYVRDFRTPQHQPFGQRPGLVHGHHALFHHQAPHLQQNSLPTMVFLMTSHDPKYQPYWSHSPTGVLPGIPPPDLARGWLYQIGWCTGFISWVQLDSEDFSG